MDSRRSFSLAVVAVLACTRVRAPAPPIEPEPTDAGGDVARPPDAGVDRAVIADAVLDRAEDRLQPDRSAPDAEPPAIFHARGFPLRALDVIPKSGLAPAELVLVSTLQGLVARSSAEQIYIDEGGPSAVWKQNLADRHGVTLDGSRTWPALLERFRAQVKGYVLYDLANPRSLTAATALAGPLDAIAVDVTIEDRVKALGLTLAADVRGHDEKWVFDQYPGRFSTRTAAELDPAISHQLRDYITLTRSFVFYDGLTPFRTKVMQALDREAFCFGYYGLDEFNMVAGASAQGVVMVPSDFAANLSVHSSVRSGEGLVQRPAAAPMPEAGVHYVTFVLSDGDNIAFDLWTMQSTYADPARGAFDMGYELSPALVDLAPATMRWYYENASHGAHRDVFVAGPSGSGYMFPSKMPAADLPPYLDRLDTFLAAGSLSIVAILDRGAVGRMDLWSAYLARPHVDALFYFDYDYGTRGEISFSPQGKPVIASRDRLWGGITEEADLIARINARPRDPKSADSYTLVQVHVWTKKLPNVLTVVKGLDPHVRVVAPDTFVQLVRMNLR